MTDFDQVLEHWGVKREYLDNVIRNLCIETIFYILAGAWGFYYFITNTGYNIAGLAWGFLGIVTLVARGWRIMPQHIFPLP